MREYRGLAKLALYGNITGGLKPMKRATKDKIEPKKVFKIKEDGTTSKIKTPLKNA